MRPAPRARAERLEAALEARGLDALLLTDLIDIRWLTGFEGSNAACLCGPGIRLFLTDSRYEEVSRATLSDWQVEIVRGDWLAGVAAATRLHCGSGSIGFQDDNLTVRAMKKLEASLADADQDGPELRPAGGIPKALRRTKDSDEVAAIALAASLADEIYRETLARGLEGRSELDVARFALALMRERGAEPSFEPIVAAGPNGALPHAMPGERRIAPGDLVVFDMGVELGGVCSDCTRTYAVGEPDVEAVRVYETVLAAQEAGLAAIAAGVEGRAVDAAARKVIDDEGYGPNFGHGLGHGVGLEVHEAPRLSPLSEDTLQVGDVVTVEPGIYLPGRFGVRIEDLVVVTDSGIRNLSGLEKQLTTVA